MCTGGGGGIKRGRTNFTISVVVFFGMLPLAEIRVILDIPISTQPTLVLKHSQAKMARKPIKIGILG